jgi:hypothetical protein
MPPPEPLMSVPELMYSLDGGPECFESATFHLKKCFISSPALLMPNHFEFAKTGKGVVRGSTRQDLCSRFVNCSVAPGTHGYKILFRVLSSVASVRQVVDFKSGQ